MSVGALSGWVAKLGEKIDLIANTYITNIVTELSAAIAPVVLVALTIWWFLLGWAVIRGEVQNSITTVIWKAVKASLIVSFALNAALYNDKIVTFADGLRDGMATTFASAAAIDGGVTPATMWDAIDAMSETNYALLNEAAKETSWYDLASAIALMLMDVGFLILSLAAVYIAILSKLFGSFFLGVGPIFIACLIFKPTQRFFDGWLGMVLNTVVLSWLGLFVVSLSLHVSTEFATALTGKWSVEVNPVTTSLQYCGICLVLAMMIYQAPSWAAALTGGSSMQMGAAMARDVAMSYRAVRGNATPGNTNVSNTIQQQSRLARLSNAMGRASGAAVRGGSSAMRTARYRLAALRGRA